MKLSLKQYKNGDLLVFAVVLIALEFINVLAITSWFPFELYTFSLFLPIFVLVLMRWGMPAVIHAFLGGVVFAVANDGTFSQIAVYAVGNALSILAIIYLNKVGKEKVRASVLYTIILVVIAHILACVGRGAISLLFNANIAVFLEFLVTDAFSLCVAIIIILIARKQNGLYENQITYLRRIQDEEKKKKQEKALN